MEVKETIGINTSKLDFDVRIHFNQMYAHFVNSNNGFDKMIKWISLLFLFLSKSLKINSRFTPIGKSLN